VKLREVVPANTRLELLDGPKAITEDLGERLIARASLTWDSMNRNRFNKTSRLRFESSVTMRLDRPKVIRPRIGRLLLLVVGLAAIVALAVWGVRSLRLPVRTVKGDVVARAAGVVLSALKSGSMEQALDVCAEGEAGGRILAEDDSQRAKPTAAPTAAKVSSPKHGSVSAAEFLTSVRASLANQGVAWEQIRPLAFGGMQANVQDARHMKDAAVSVVGEIYFGAKDQVYALELSARCCGDKAVITDFWRCAPIGVPASAPLSVLEDRTAARIRAFTLEPIKPGERVAVKSPRLVFTSLQ